MDMKLRFLKGRLRGRTVEVGEEGFSIGRSSDNDLHLDEDGVSRHHCRLYKEDDSWYVEDLGSTNGVRVNGELAGQRRQVMPGDRIGVSGQVFLFTDAAHVMDIGASAGGEAGGTHRVESAGAAQAAGEQWREDLKSDEPGGIEPPRDETDIEGMSEGFPWLHVLLLVAVLGALAWFLYIAFLAPSAVAPSQREAGSEEIVPKDSVVIPEEPSPADVAEPGETFTPAEVTEVEDPSAEEPVEADEQGAPATVIIKTDPPGASVAFDDQPVGVSPVVVRDVAPGRHKITLASPGYEELVRQIYNPGMLPDEPYELRLKPGAVRITSEPPGATVVHGTQILGQTPLTIEQLPPGRHELRFLSYGYTSITKPVEVSDIRGETVHVDLAPAFGAMRVITIPAGCHVYVNGLLKGITVAAEDRDRNLSEAFQLPGLRVGAHDVRITHPNGGEHEERLTIKAGETTTAVLKMWVLDTKVELTDGTVKYGMLLSRDAEHGDIVLAEPKPERYLREQIRKVEELTPEEARELRETRGPSSPEEDDDVPAAP
ncbi:MAG: PEGA domain-containing protein [Candidatus Pacebacteria bacterium]|nr:PEGA domain-containing protein [Candidatus Paceibacterota bacterium]